MLCKFTQMQAVSVVPSVDLQSKPCFAIFVFPLSSSTVLNHCCDDQVNLVSICVAAS